VKVELEHVVAHPVDRVFAVMSDPSKRPLWQENSRRVEVLTPGPASLGTRWRESIHGIGSVEAEVVGFEPNALWTEEGTSRGGRGRISVTFHPEGDVTRLTVHVEMRLRGAKRVMEPALGPMIRHQMPRDLERLSTRLDGGS
jgi:uncharacterized protein YndB with AHSA1/START domain